jgi:hypothetical protein
LHNPQEGRGVASYGIIDEFFLADSRKRREETKEIV